MALASSLGMSDAARLQLAESTPEGPLPLLQDELALSGTSASSLSLPASPAPAPSAPRSSGLPASTPYELLLGHIRSRSRGAPEAPATGASTPKPILLTPTTLLNLQALALAACRSTATTAAPPRGEAAGPSSSAPAPHSMSAPVLVSGPPGVGKSILIDELARATGNEVVRLYLGDQSDARDILGTYVCTDVAGEFRWQPGLLTRAVTSVRPQTSGDLRTLVARMGSSAPMVLTPAPSALCRHLAQGSWLVIEDIETVSFEVIAVLIPLLESGRLLIPSRAETIAAHPAFQLWATCTSFPAASGPGASSGGANEISDPDSGTGMGGVASASASSKQSLAVVKRYMTEVVVHGLRAPELGALLRARYPALRPLSGLLLSGFLTAIHTFRHPPAALAAAVGGGIALTGEAWPGGVDEVLRAVGAMPPAEQDELHGRLWGRWVTVRDLFRWCDRLQKTVASQLPPAGPAPSAPRGYTMEALLEELRADPQTTVAMGTLEQAYLEALDLFLGPLPHTAPAALTAPAPSPASSPKPGSGPASGPSGPSASALLVGQQLRMRELLTARLAPLFRLPPERVAALTEGRTPAWQPVASPVRAVEVGRFQMPLGPSAPAQPQGPAPAGPAAQRPYVRTRAMLLLLERLAGCVAAGEPALLVGETGAGKATAIRHLAGALHQPLQVYNLTQQSESSDLLGGFRPVSVGQICMGLVNRFVDLFGRTFSARANGPFLDRLRRAFDRQQWRPLVKLLRGAIKMVDAKQRAAAAALAPSPVAALAPSPVAALAPSPVAKKRPPPPAAQAEKAGGDAGAAVLTAALAEEWARMGATLQQFERQLAATSGEEAPANESGAGAGFGFAFVEGVLVKALREGQWVLLDEINMASQETLERLSSLLEGTQGTLCLYERGDTAPLQRHPNFRLFASMTPPHSDVGKRDLPGALRSRFTELFVDELEQPAELADLVRQYLPRELPLGRLVPAVVSFYLAARRHAQTGLTDGTAQKPRYSLRTLCRSLEYLATGAPVYGLARTLYDGFAMSFMSLLGDSSQPAMRHIILSHLIAPSVGEAALAQLDNQLVTDPKARPDTIRVEHFLLPRGPLEAHEVPGYTITPTVQRHLTELCRAATLLHGYPVLLQGPTSAGKTAMVEYLAHRTGHRFVRINNHEQTDLREYIGTYATNEQGRFDFVDGPLVQALKHGDWIVLDELNLASAEVLEALNRLLDDSHRELFVADTQERVRPHPHFMLFATQNPPGLYGGRKVLSRAFRQRFTILERRCGMAPSHCARLVGIMKALELSRSRSQIFAGKHGFITLRDLFRWALRAAQPHQTAAGAPPGLDLSVHALLPLAREGYYLLAERLRTPEERRVVQEVLEKVLKVTLPGPDALYGLHTASAAQARADQQRLGARSRAEVLMAGAVPDMDAFLVAHFPDLRWLLPAYRHLLPAPEQAQCPAELEPFRSIVWTTSFKRLFVLVARAMIAEPVLIVGDTGCGKTTVCQLLAALLQRPLHILNCHRNTETADLLGGLRPVRGREDIDRRLRAALERCLALRQCAPAASEPAPTLADLVARFERCAPAPSPSPSPPPMTPPPAASPPPEGDRPAKRDRTEPEEAPAPVPAPSPAQQVEEEVRSLLKQHRQLFAWYDGPLVTAMRAGHMLVLDEISLADDAALERLNSVLEPSRTLGGTPVEEIVAVPNFALLATMNPGGDFGKKELSPALRNRFTEIWAPQVTDPEDLRAIVEAHLHPALPRGLVEDVMSFLAFMPQAQQQQPAKAPPRRLPALLEQQPCPGRPGAGLGAPIGELAGEPSVRDLLAWVHFTNCTFPILGDLGALLHGCCMMLLDGLAVRTAWSEQACLTARDNCARFFFERYGAQLGQPAEPTYAALTATLGRPVSLGPGSPPLEEPRSEAAARFGVAPFFIDRGPAPHPGALQYSLRARTTARNASRVLRAMQLHRPVLLEGSPGVGKTSLITALARASGHSLTRINLSEQTDLVDLLGCDLPVEGEGTFSWSDGIFLKALKAGDWVILDELNLASQTVLEGLNACLDHRAEVYIPELQRTFVCPPSFCVFACQNPYNQGGGRKGLPKSFLNRFTQVYVDALDGEDYLFILETLYPALPAALLGAMIRFNQAVHQAVTVEARFGRAGAPWEFNLRDMVRWCDMVAAVAGPTAPEGPLSPALVGAAARFMEVLYMHRLRSRWDRAQVGAAFAQIFGPGARLEECPLDYSTPQFVQIGHAVLPRLLHTPAQPALDEQAQPQLPSPAAARPVLLLHHQRSALQALMHAIARGWLSIITGPGGAGKTALTRPAQTRPAQTRPAQTRPAQTRPAQTRPAQTRPAQTHPPADPPLFAMFARAFSPVVALLTRPCFPFAPAWDGWRGRGMDGGVVQVRYLAQATGNTVHEFPMSSAVDTSELLGGYEQADLGRHARSLRDQMGHCAGLLMQALLLASAAPAGPVNREAALGCCERLKESLGHVGAALAHFNEAAAATTSAATATAPAPTTGPLEAYLGRLRSLLALCTEARALALCGPQPQGGAGCPVGEADLGRLGEEIRRLEGLGQVGAGGNFEWLDGVLVKALEQGHWLVLDNVNFCSPTVLDRLNPLLEQDGLGILTLTEQGLAPGQTEPRVIRAHPNFRLIFVMDPKYGEISRAMRNRGIEIFLLSPAEFALDLPPLIAPAEVAPASKDDKAPVATASVTLTAPADWAELVALGPTPAPKHPAASGAAADAGAGQGPPPSMAEGLLEGLQGAQPGPTDPLAPADVAALRALHWLAPQAALGRSLVALGAPGASKKRPAKATQPPAEMAAPACEPHALAARWCEAHPREAVLLADGMRLLNAIGIPGAELPIRMYLFHTALARHFLPAGLQALGRPFPYEEAEGDGAEQPAPLPATAGMAPPTGSLAQGGIKARSFRHLVHWASLTREHLATGAASLYESLRYCMGLTYTPARMTAAQAPQAPAGPERRPTDLLADEDADEDPSAPTSGGAAPGEQARSLAADLYERLFGDLAEPGADAGAGAQERRESILGMTGGGLTALADPLLCTPRPLGLPSAQGALLRRACGPLVFLLRACCAPGQLPLVVLGRLAAQVRTVLPPELHGAAGWYLGRAVQGASAAEWVVREGLCPFMQDRPLAGPGTEPWAALVATLQERRGAALAELAGLLAQAQEAEMAALRARAKGPVTSFMSGASRMDAALLRHQPTDPRHNQPLLDLVAAQAAGSSPRAAELVGDLGRLGAQLQLATALRLHGLLVERPHLVQGPVAFPALSALQASYALAPRVAQESAPQWCQRVDPFRLRQALPHTAVAHVWPLVGALGRLVAAWVRDGRLAEPLGTLGHLYQYLWRLLSAAAAPSPAGPTRAARPSADKATLTVSFPMDLFAGALHRLQKTLLALPADGLPDELAAIMRAVQLCLFGAPAAAPGAQAPAPVDLARTARLLAVPVTKSWLWLRMGHPPALFQQGQGRWMAIQARLLPLLRALSLLGHHATTGLGWLTFDEARVYPTQAALLPRALTAAQRRVDRELEASAAPGAAPTQLSWSFGGGIKKKKQAAAEGAAEGLQGGHGQRRDPVLDGLADLLLVPERVPSDEDDEGAAALALPEAPQQPHGPHLKKGSTAGLIAEARTLFMAETTGRVAGPLPARLLALVPPAALAAAGTRADPALIASYGELRPLLVQAAATLLWAATADDERTQQEAARGAATPLPTGAPPAATAPAITASAAPAGDLAAAVAPLEGAPAMMAARLLGAWRLCQPTAAPSSSGTTAPAASALPTTVAAVANAPQGLTLLLAAALVRDRRLLAALQQVAAQAAVALALGAACPPEQLRALAGAARRLLGQWVDSRETLLPTTLPLADAAPLQLIAWAAEAGPQSPSSQWAFAVHQATTALQGALWSPLFPAAFGPDRVLAGPGLLQRPLEPALLLELASRCAVLPLAAIRPRAEVLRSLLASLCGAARPRALAAAGHPAWVEARTAMAVLLHSVGALGASIPAGPARRRFEELLAQLRAALLLAAPAPAPAAEGAAPLGALCEELCALLRLESRDGRMGALPQTAPGQPAAGLVAWCVAPALALARHLVALPADAPEEAALRCEALTGALWTLVGLLDLHALLPGAPVDPALAPQSRLALLVHRRGLGCVGRAVGAAGRKLLWGQTDPPAGEAPGCEGDEAPERIAALSVEVARARTQAIRRPTQLPLPLLEPARARREMGGGQADMAAEGPEGSSETRPSDEADRIVAHAAAHGALLAGPPPAQEDDEAAAEERAEVLPAEDRALAGVPHYGSLHREVQHYLATAAPPHMAADLLQALLAAAQAAPAEGIPWPPREEGAAPLEGPAQALAREVRWQENGRGFVRRLSEQYGAAYPDVVGPLATAATRCLHGLRMCARPALVATQWPTAPPKDAAPTPTLLQAARALVSVPTVRPEQLSRLEAARVLTAPQTAATLEGFLVGGLSPAALRTSLLQMGLAHLCLHVMGLAAPAGQGTQSARQALESHQDRAGRLGEALPLLEATLGRFVMAWSQWHLAQLRAAEEKAALFKARPGRGKQAATIAKGAEPLDAAGVVTAMERGEHIDTETIRRYAMTLGSAGPMPRGAAADPDNFRAGGPRGANKKPAAQAGGSGAVSALGLDSEEQVKARQEAQQARECATLFPDYFGDFADMRTDEGDPLLWAHQQQQGQGPAGPAPSSAGESANNSNVDGIDVAALKDPEWAERLGEAFVAVFAGADALEEALAGDEDILEQEAADAERAAAAALRGSAPAAPAPATASRQTRLLRRRAAAMKHRRQRAAALAAANPMNVGGQAVPLLDLIQAESARLGAALLPALQERLPAAFEGQAQGWALLTLALPLLQATPPPAPSGAEVALGCAPATGRLAADLLRETQATLGAALSPEDLAAAVGAGDPYHDPYPAEAQLAVGPLLEMRARVQQLLSRFPGVLPLRNIDALCARLLGFPHGTPLAKFLMGIELLHTEAQQRWELGQEDRSLTLAPQIRLLQALIVRWRRLEVHSWSTLLRARARAHRSRALRWWFRLYEVLFMRGPLSHLQDPANEPPAPTPADQDQAPEEEGEAPAQGRSDAPPTAATCLGPGTGGRMEGGPGRAGAHLGPLVGVRCGRGSDGADLDAAGAEGYLREALQTVDAFLHASTLGEFPARMALARALLNHMRLWRARLAAPHRGCRAPAAPAEGPVCPRCALAARYVERLAGGAEQLLAHYGLFAEQRDRVLQGRARPVLDQLRQHARLARWDEMNFEALRESKLRQHRKLLLFLHRYDEALEGPMGDLILTPAEQQWTAQPQSRAAFGLLQEGAAPGSGALAEDLARMGGEEEAPEAEQPDSAQQPPATDGAAATPTSASGAHLAAAPSGGEGWLVAEGLLGPKTDEQAAPAPGGALVLPLLGGRTLGQLARTLRALSRASIRPAPSPKAEGPAGVRNPARLLEAAAGHLGETVDEIIAQCAAFHQASAAARAEIDRQVQAKQAALKAAREAARAAPGRKKLSWHDQEAAAGEIKVPTGGLASRQVQHAGLVSLLRALRRMGLGTAPLRTGASSLLGDLIDLTAAAAEPAPSAAAAAAAGPVAAFAGAEPPSANGLALPTASLGSHLAMLLRACTCRWVAPAAVAGLGRDWAAAEGYFTRCLVRMSALRASSRGAPNGQLQPVERDRCMMSAEAALALVAHQRTLLAEALRQLPRLVAALEWLAALGAAKEVKEGPAAPKEGAAAGVGRLALPEPEWAAHWLGLLERTGMALRDHLTQLGTLAATLAQALPAQAAPTSQAARAQAHLRALVGAIGPVMAALDNQRSAAAAARPQQPQQHERPLPLAMPLPSGAALDWWASQGCPALQGALGELLGLLERPFVEEGARPEEAGPMGLLDQATGPYLRLVAAQLADFQAQYRARAAPRPAEGEQAASQAQAERVQAALAVPLQAVAEWVLAANQQAMSGREDRPDPAAPEDEADEDGCIRRAHRRLAEACRWYALGPLWARLDPLLAAAAGLLADPAAGVHVARTLAPLTGLLGQHLATAVRMATAGAQWHRSAGKLTYVLVNTFNGLLAKGFCAVTAQDARDAEQQALDEQAKAEADKNGPSGAPQAGVGMGEGEGEKDVSGQITHEDQLLGMREEEPQPPKDQPEEPNQGGFDVAADFQADLQDMPQQEQPSALAPGPRPRPSPPALAPASPPALAPALAPGPRPRPSPPALAPGLAPGPRPPALAPRPSPPGPRPPALAPRPSPPASPPALAPGPRPRPSPRPSPPALAPGPRPPALAPRPSPPGPRPRLSDAAAKPEPEEGDQQPSGAPRAGKDKPQKPRPGQPKGGDRAREEQPPQEGDDQQAGEAPQEGDDQPGQAEDDGAGEGPEGPPEEERAGPEQAPNEGEGPALEDAQAPGAAPELPEELTLDREPDGEGPAPDEAAPDEAEADEQEGPGAKDSKDLEVEVEAEPPSDQAAPLEPMTAEDAEKPAEGEAEAEGEAAPMEKEPEGGLQQEEPVPAPSPEGEPQAQPAEEEAPREEQQGAGGQDQAHPEKPAPQGAAGQEGRGGRGAPLSGPQPQGQKGPGEEANEEDKEGAEEGPKEGPVDEQQAEQPAQPEIGAAQEKGEAGEEEGRMGQHARPTADEEEEGRWRINRPDQAPQPQGEPRPRDANPLHDTNPFRSTGAAARAWHRRLHMLADPTAPEEDEAPRPDQPTAQEATPEGQQAPEAQAQAGTFRFARERGAQAEAQAETQVLGAATQEQLTQEPEAQVHEPPEEQPQGPQQQQEEDQTDGAKGRAAQDALDQDEPDLAPMQLDAPEPHGRRKGKQNQRRPEGGQPEGEGEGEAGPLEPQEAPGPGEGAAQPEAPPPASYAVTKEALLTQQRPVQAPPGPASQEAAPEEQQQPVTDEVRHAAHPLPECSARPCRPTAPPSPPRLAPFLAGDAPADPASPSSHSSSERRARGAECERRWEQMEAATGDLAQDLCEQLRLILAPTLASKLRGDFRSGRRLNMRKVIPYIASHFRKDKIWMRRAQPDKRRYQVLVCIDDSASMALAGAGNMALAALAVLCRALARLEVGQIAVCSFGDQVRLVHPFDVPFSDQCGPAVVGQFTFAQRSTNVGALMRAVTGLLYQARFGAASPPAGATLTGLPPQAPGSELLGTGPAGGGGGADGSAQQLCFVLSDGRISDKRGLVGMVAEAASKGIFLVFVILDNCPGPAGAPAAAGGSKAVTTSIVDMKTITFPGPGKVVAVPYLEDFPFPYYVILRDVQALPEVLGDALRQWIELMERTSAARA
ncbi:putative AAA ATPase midasin [Paratrimastix pyriformis]|uniref:AAA ATPase midasin n=1 Tax=Paratrimastix pyriformis TaxID=342808 RepID=A0ABQ8UKG5_9EUKA|nr:putative AAA ATPase midasin [Paratrimastix pyriformis]